MSNNDEYTSRTHWNKQEIKGRGWTMTMIDRFLPNPDTTRPNPYCKSGPPMKLYAIKRVLEVEETEQFTKVMEKSASRKKAAKKAVETKEKKLLKYIDSVEITVPIMSIEKLSRRAIEAYNDRQLDRMLCRGRAYDNDFDNRADEDSDTEFLDRITVNYLRHELTEYDNELELISGKIGKHIAYAKLKEIMLNAISEAYPELAIECQRQIQSIHCPEIYD